MIPALELDPPALTLGPGTATTTPAVALLRNVGSGTAVLEPLEIGDGRIDAQLDVTSIFPGQTAQLSVRFVAPPTATLDSWVRIAWEGQCPSEQLELRLSSP